MEGQLICCHYRSLRDRGASLALGEGRGAPLVTQYWGGTKHFFLLILYSFKKYWGGARAPQPPYSAVPEPAAGWVGVRGIMT